MASALLQLKAFGASPCSNLPALQARSDKILGGVGNSAFLVTGRKPRGFGRLSVLRGRWGTIGKKREGPWGMEMVVVAAGASPEDSSGVAVEDVAEEQLSPEEEEDQENVRDILRVVELLRTKRDMTFNEVRLTIMIEDPRDVERRRLLNIEDDRGCSREELGNALVEVYEGRYPQDTITLRELAKEMLNWPNLEEEIYAQGRTPPVASPYAKVTDTGVDPRVAAERAQVDWDSASDIQPGQEKKDLSEVLPPAVGFSFLYLLSALPIIIGITVVVILFLNSLQ